MKLFHRGLSIRGEFLVIGSGVGGATVAKELATRGHKVTILEKGRYQKLGTESGSLRFYSTQRAVEGMEILKADIVGGSSMVTLANGVRALQNELSRVGINLETEFQEAEAELGVSPFPEDFMGDRTRRLMKASNELGFDVKPMPKFIDFQKCRRCGYCGQGCIYGAKWTAQKSIGEAVKAGAKLLMNTSADLVLHSGGAVKGVRVRSPSGVTEIVAENVVVAAGGVNTPVILQRSGLNDAGGNFFADPYVNTVGILREDCGGDEVSMSAVIDEFHDRDGILISPAFDKSWATFFNFPTFEKRHVRHMRKILKLMTKITDDDVGRVDIDGTIHKPLTESDQEKLRKGEDLSRSILLQAGVDPRSLFTENVRAGHPGGTAGIGRVVNTNHETEISHLFVCDASVLPVAPGMPPVLTIVALSKRLSKILLTEYI